MNFDYFTKNTDLKLLYFQACSQCHCFFLLMAIHSVSQTYIYAVCSILSNFYLHFTRPGPYIFATSLSKETEGI